MAEFTNWSSGFARPTKIFTATFLIALCELTSAHAKEFIPPPTEPEGHGEAMIPETGSMMDSDSSGASSTPFAMNYFGVLYGPSVADPSSYQPNANGAVDSSLPLLVRNYMTVTYGLSHAVSISATAPWIWQPVLNQELGAKDPYFRVADNEIFSTEHFSLYGDARFHAPVTTESRAADLLAGVQAFMIATYQVPGSRFTWGSYLSARYNVFGSQGTGNDTILYAGPNLAYQLSPKLALTTLYEMGASHIYKDKNFALNNDGTDLEPGLKWDLTKTVSVNPYLNFFTGNKMNLTSTSLGMTLSWQLL